MTIDELKALRASGKFHHATYRNEGSLWEGLWIYECAEGAGSFRGYRPAGAFYKDSPDLDAAHDLVRSTGVSLGAYGNG